MKHRGGWESERKTDRERDLVGECTGIYLWGPFCFFFMWLFSVFSNVNDKTGFSCWFCTIQWKDLKQCVRPNSITSKKNKESLWRNTLKGVTHNDRPTSMEHFSIFKLIVLVLQPATLVRSCSLFSATVRSVHCVHQRQCSGGHAVCYSGPNNRQTKLVANQWAEWSILKSWGRATQN